VLLPFHIRAELEALIYWFPDAEGKSFGGMHVDHGLDHESRMPGH